MLIFFCVLSAPLILELTTTELALARMLNPEEKETLSDRLHIPTVLSSANGMESHCLRVRRSDDTAALRNYLREQGVFSDWPRERLIRN